MTYGKTRSHMTTSQPPVESSAKFAYLADSIAFVQESIDNLRDHFGDLITIILRQQQLLEKQGEAIDRIRNATIPLPGAYTGPNRYAILRAGSGSRPEPSPGLR